MENDKEYFENDLCDNIIVTAGATYIDIDAYACSVAMAELLQLQGKNAIAFSQALENYSVCKMLNEEVCISHVLPKDYDFKTSKYVIVDVSDPDYLSKSIPINNVVAVYDHHVGFEKYWRKHIGEDSHIEFIGAASTLIYREWKKLGLLNKMKSSTAKLIVASILDNTLNLTSSVTTDEDINVFNELCLREKITNEWCIEYFSEVQNCIEKDLKNALFGDIKTIGKSHRLPYQIGQLCIWDASKIIDRLSEIREWFKESNESWMLNIIDIKDSCSYFICDDTFKIYQKILEDTLNVKFINGIAKSSQTYLRKQIIKNVGY